MILMFNDDEVVPKGDRPGDGLIEHMRQHDVIKTADWVIDLGPGGGVNGGRIIAEGPPEAIAQVALSATGPYLRPILERATVKPVIVERSPAKAGAQARKRRKETVDEDEFDLETAK